jgi:hypothetical protein
MYVSSVLLLTPCLRIFLWKFRTQVTIAKLVESPRYGMSGTYKCSLCNDSKDYIIKNLMVLIGTLLSSLGVLKIMRLNMTIKSKTEADMKLENKDKLIGGFLINIISSLLQ